MKITIITVNLNQGKFLQDCIQSVLNQTYKNIEFIVIDGGSVDESMELIKRYEQFITKWISNRDNGPYDALNKGVIMATGDVVGFLHADDIFYDNEVLEDVANVFSKYNVDSCYGDLIYIKSENSSKVYRYWKSGPYEEKLFEKGWMPPHPTFFVKKEIYNKYGLFNIQMGSAADYEIMLRFLYKYKISTLYIPRILVKMRVGGISNRSLINRLKANRLDLKAWEINGLKPPFLFRIRKPLSKLGQWFIFQKKNL